MGYNKNTVDGLHELSGDGTGWADIEQELPVPGSGANQMFVAFQHYVEGLSPDAAINETGLSWSPSLYWGLKFDNTHILTNEDKATDTAAQNLLGVRQRNGGASYDDAASINSLDLNSVGDDYALPAGTISGILPCEFIDGQDGLIDSKTHQTGSLQKSNAEMLMTVPVGSTIGEAATYCFRIFTNESDEGVRFEGWINTDSIDLETFDINDSGQFDPDDPKGAFRVSNSWTTGEVLINGTSETGTNWRPSSGVMAFPTHFMARWPFGTVGLNYILDKNILVKFSELYA